MKEKCPRCKRGILIRSPIFGDSLICNNGCGYRIFTIKTDDNKERPQSSLLDFK
jgi:hypothetical protein